MAKIGFSGSAVKQQAVQALSKLTPVKEKLTEARVQVQDYRQKLLRKYGDALRLRTYTVVAIGFERVLWEEVK